MMTQLTTRAVLYVGFLCNLRCRFCYYLYAGAREWFSLERCKEHARIFREIYGNDAVDITGGEPTIYPDILELVGYCRDIGLRPTLITNAQALADPDKVRAFKDAGVEDFLVSIHAFNRQYDEIVGKEKGFEAIVYALANLHDHEIPYRVNCVLTKISRPQLLKIARFCFTSGANVLNFISYNPFYKWAHYNVPDFQARHSEIGGALEEALDYCDAVGMEANVRYFPFCLMPARHMDKCYNWPQLFYDPGEWDMYSWFSARVDSPADKYVDEFYQKFPKKEDAVYELARQRKERMYAHSPRCQGCVMRHICDGLTRQYFARFGDSELKPWNAGDDNSLPPDMFIRFRKKYLLKTTWRGKTGLNLI